MIEIRRNPDRRELLVFGFLLTVFVLALGLGLELRWDAPRAARAVWAGGALLVSAYFLVPRLRRPLYLGWMLAVFPIGWIVSHLLLALVYYLVLTPIALTLRLAGRDLLARRLDRSAASYWSEHVSRPDPDRYFRQY